MKFKNEEEKNEFVINIPYELANMCNKENFKNIGIDDAWIDSNDIVIFDSWRQIPDIIKETFFINTGLKISSCYDEEVFDGDGGYRHQIDLDVPPLSSDIKHISNKIYNIAMKNLKLFDTDIEPEEVEKNIWRYDVNLIYDNDSKVIKTTKDINNIPHVFAMEGYNEDDGDWTIECIIDGRQPEEIIL